MRLTVLGCSPSFPNPGKATSSYLVRTEDTAVLADCGHGATSSLRLHREPWTLDAIVISHMDPDHFFDLVPLNYTVRFLGPAQCSVPVWLPPGGLGFMHRFAGALDSGGHTLSSLTLQEYDPDRGLECGSIRIAFARARHFIPSWGMRFTSPDQADIAYTSDTARSDEVIELLRDVPLAVVEATQLVYRNPQDAEGHCTASVAAEMARNASVTRLILTHYPVQEATALLAAARAVFGGNVTLAEQGMTYDSVTP